MGKKNALFVTDVIFRAFSYVAAMPPAIAGSRGHDAAFAVALALRHGFALSKAQAQPIIQEFNARCEPPWSEKELEHKLDSAGKVTRHPKPRGYLLGARGPAPSPESGPRVTVLNIDTSEPLPGESQPKSAVLPSENSEISIPSVPDAELTPEQLAEARRIAAELKRLRRDGAISNMADAQFYATLLKAFGASITGFATSGPR